MGIELPVELTDVAAKAGVSWPKADEDAMRASATAWRDAGDKIKGLGTSSDGAATRALDGLSGATGDAARGRWAKVVAPDGELQRAARGCHAAADRLDHAAKQVGAAKVEIVRELVTLAKNNDAAQVSASTGNPNALLGLDTLTKGTAANVANLQNTLSSAVRIDSGVDMSHGSQPVNTSPGAHGPGGGGGLLAPVTNIVGGVVAPVAAVVAPVAETVAPVVGAVTAPVVGAVTAPVAPAVGAVGEVAAPVLGAAAPVTAPVAAVVPQVGDAVGPAFDGRGEGNGEGPGRGEDPGRGEGQGKGLLPGLLPETAQAVGQAVGQVVPPVAAPVVAAVADVIPSVQGTLGPVAEGTTQASAAVLEQPLIRGEAPGQPAAAAPQAAAPAAPAAPAGPTLGGAPVGGAVGGAVGGVASAAPAAASALGAVAGQQAPGQQGQAAQAGQQAAKAVDAKAADAKAADARVAEAKSAAPAAAKAGVPGAVPAGQMQVGGQSGTQLPAQGQTGHQPGQSQGSGHGGNQPAGQAPQAQAGAKDAAAKDLAKDGPDALPEGAADVAGTDAGTRQVSETVVSAPAAPMAGVDLGGQPGGALTDRLDNREQAQALSGGVAFEVARHTYNAAALGSWFMAVFLSAGQPPRLAPKPARQLPAPVREEQQAVPRFAPQDHPEAGLVDTSFPQPAEPTEGLGEDHPIVQELLAGHDPLAGMHERDWESLFLDDDGTPRWLVEREGGYEDSQPEIVRTGTELDRFGTPEGRVLAKAGTPFKERSLPPVAATEGYRRYRVVRDLPVHRTISAPWFGQPGGGSRYRTTYPVADLVALGYLTEITA